jgi:hypothetical protein
MGISCGEHEEDNLDPISNENIFDNLNLDLDYKHSSNAVIQE